MDKAMLYAKIRREVADHAGGRGESASFLIWFLENYFRLEHDDAIGDVCDHINDKGLMVFTLMMKTRPSIFSSPNIVLTITRIKAIMTSGILSAQDNGLQRKPVLTSC